MVIRVGRVKMLFKDVSLFEDLFVAVNFGFREPSIIDW